MVKANVARSDDEAELQAKGIDVIGQVAEDDRAEGEGFTEEFDPNAEPGELPVEAPVEGEEPAEG
jgi:large subunit ribosomal protein L9